MSETNLSWQDRAALGAVAGFCATLLMTSAMERLHRRLLAEERYPLTPREITERAAPQLSEPATATNTVLAHFAYGALTGALLGAVAERRAGIVSGALFGVGVWCASYLGWIPAFGILKPATAHPPRRNALMLVVHLIWGAATALGFNELRRAHRGAFAGGPLKDAQARGLLLTRSDR